MNILNAHSVFSISDARRPPADGMTTYDARVIERQTMTINLNVPDISELKPRHYRRSASVALAATPSTT